SGVLVRVYNLASGFDYGKRTDSEGFYRIGLLLAGEYRITGEKEGYEAAEIPRFLAEVNREKAIIPPPLQLLKINKGTPLPPIITSNILQVNIVDPTIRGSAGTDLISSLPIGGIRSFDSLALLVPGVVPPPERTGVNGPGIGNGVG